MLIRFYRSIFLEQYPSDKGFFLDFLESNVNSSEQQWTAVWYVAQMS